MVASSYCWLVQDTTPAGTGKGRAYFVARGGHAEASAAADALVSEGQQWPGLVVEILDARREAWAPSPEGIPGSYVLEPGARVVLAHCPTSGSGARFFVAAAVEPEHVGDGSSARAAFESLRGTCVLAEVVAIGSAEGGSFAKVRYEDGGVAAVE
jgi:hypothetical protein